MKCLMLSLMGIALVVGCREPTSSAGRPTTLETQAAAEPEKPAGPLIEELPEEGKLLKELVDIDAHVFGFSGTLLAVWLESETKFEGEESKPRGMGAVTVARSSIRSDSPASVRGKFIVFGTLMENPSLSILYESESNGGRTGLGSSKPPLAPPWPTTGSFGGSGYKWECPETLPDVGEKFLIATIHKSVLAPAPTEQEPYKMKAIRETTLRIMGERLPGAPEPTDAERMAVMSLRAGGASVFTNSSDGRDYGSRYEGDPRTNAKKVVFHSNGFRADAFEKSRANLHLLEQLRELESLSFQYTKIVDDDLALLKNLTWLQRLKLRRTKVTGAGFVHLKTLTKLRDLDLDSTDVTDETLEHIAALRDLEVLRLSSTKITDAGVESLYGMENLKQLWLTRTGVSDEAVLNLKGTLPNCDVRH